MLFIYTLNVKYLLFYQRYVIFTNAFTVNTFVSSCPANPKPDTCSSWIFLYVHIYLYIFFYLQTLRNNLNINSATQATLNTTIRGNFCILEHFESYTSCKLRLVIQIQITGWRRPLTSFELYHSYSTSSNTLLCLPFH